MIGQEAVDGEFGVEIGQLVLSDLPPQQRSQLLIAGVLVQKLVHRLGKDAAQPHIRLDHSLLRGNQLLGDGIPEQKISGMSG